MSMVGVMQYSDALGRTDIFAATTSMSRFRAAPCKRHLARLKRVNA